MTKILVVDDEVKECELLRRFFEKKGYTVITSNNGMDAIEKVQNESPDIMLLDIRMPGMDGVEVLKCVREFNKKIGIIMVTAVMDEDIAKNTMKLGADEYITKPIDLERLEMHVLVDLIMREK
ncbi:MAG TPA: response regulator transcription factor [Candidatus Wunengus sp. YC61]|uniref:response regulator transcription factor n=1 Tax=Candidatus Wunengus sp. YC61 TaxID=3367698 RepID=UPI0040297C0D